MSANDKTTEKPLDQHSCFGVKGLYGRMMILARSSRDINQKESIGNQEFTLTLRALVALDGTILDKSKVPFFNKMATVETSHDDQQP